ncbi:MAG TPA: hypothetical protein EYH32_04890 [Anaerolineae bacterium]|nr:hypothetical protein [Anaerolineae bacterium]
MADVMLTPKVLSTGTVEIELDPDALSVVVQIAKDEALSLSEAVCFIIREYERLAAAEWRDMDDPVRAQAWADYWDAHYESTVY